MAEFVEIELAEPMEVHEAVQKMTAALPRGIQIMAADVTANNAPALMLPPEVQIILLCCLIPVSMLRQ